MSRTRISGWTLALAVAGTAGTPLLAPPLVAQVAAPRFERSAFVPPSSAAVARRDVMLSMRTMLRLATTAQEQYFANHATYTNQVDVLRSGFTASWDAAVRVGIVFAGPRAWSGVATHPSLPGRSCVIFVGDTSELPSLPRTAGGRSPEEEGMPVCDQG